MKKILTFIVFLYVLSMVSCHTDPNSTLNITVVDENEKVQDGVKVGIKPANGGDADWLIDEKITDNSGQVLFVLEDWANGSAWGTTLIVTCLRGTDTLEILEPRRGQIMVYQKGGEYNGDDFNETIIIK